MSYRDELARRYGCPLKIHARGYDAYLVGAQPLLEGGASDDGGDREDTLSSDARKYDVLLHGSMLLCSFSYAPPHGAWRSGCIRGAG